MPLNLKPSFTQSFETKMSVYTTEEGKWVRWKSFLLWSVLKNNKLCSGQDPPSTAVFAYWKHPVGPPAEHKAPGAQAAPRRSSWGLQPQCLWRSLSPPGLCRGLQTERERSRGYKRITSHFPLLTASVWMRRRHNHMSNICLQQTWWLTHPVQTASACSPSPTCCRLRDTSPLCSSLRRKQSSGWNEGRRGEAHSGRPAK